MHFENHCFTILFYKKESDNKMNTKLFISLILLSFSCTLQAGEREMIDEVPPPPAISEEDLSADDVTIIHKDQTRFEEYRKNGKLYMVKVTPSVGPEYYLVDLHGDGRFERIKQGIGDPVFPAPRWVLFSW